MRERGRLLCAYSLLLRVVCCPVAGGGLVVCVACSQCDACSLSLFSCGCCWLLVRFAAVSRIQETCQLVWCVGDAVLRHVEWRRVLLASWSGGGGVVGVDALRWFQSLPVCVAFAAAVCECLRCLLCVCGRNGCVGGDVVVVVVVVFCCRAPLILAVSFGD